MEKLIDADPDQIILGVCWKICL